MGTIRRLGAVGALGLGFTVACGPNDRSAQNQIDQKTISDLRERKVLRQINEETENAKRLEQFVAYSDGSDVSVGTETSVNIAPAAAPPDPCPEVPANPMLDAKYPAISTMYACFRRLLEPAKAWDEAAAVFRTRPVAEEPFSGLTLDLIRPRIQRVPVTLRREFLPSELDELTTIYRKRREAYAAVEKKVFEVLRKHESWLTTTILPNMKGLLALMRNDGLVDRQLSELGSVLGTVPTADWKRLVPAQYISPYGVAYLIPSESDEMMTTVVTGQTPFDYLLKHAALLEVSSTQEHIIRGFYESMRASDPPQVDVSTLPERVAPAENAVRVAFVDSGVDFKTLPSLGRYLTLGGAGFTSADYSEGDENPWEPLGIVTGLGHGSGTVSSMLTVLSDLNDRLLSGGKLSLAVWKTFSNRQILAGALGPLAGLWENRPYSVTDALMGELSKPVLPHVVSMSVGFTGWRFLSARAPDLLLHSTSLFVMAAGNQGAKVEESAAFPSCFKDVPAEKRPADRILCVGALKRGVTQGDTTVASYSNYGNLVDVYTLESYFEDVCANGTSCATPVMSAMAAALFEKFPTMTAAQAKRIIVAAAVEKEFKVQGRTEVRKVRYFNPYLHYTRMMEEAQKVMNPEPMLASAAGSGGRGK